MNKRLVNFIKGLSIKDLLYIYEKYYDMAFTFYINSDREKYNKTMNVVNLIDNALREKGYWKKKR